MEKTEQPADSTVDEPSAVDLESTGVLVPSAVDLESTGVSGVTCEKWVTCKDGFFGSIRCSGTRYCEVWRPRRLQFEEEAPEAAEKTEQSADTTVDEPSAVDLESTGVSGVTCEKWVTCKDGFFGNIRCSGTRYCEVWRPRRLQFEEEAPEAAEKTEQSADSTVDEPSAVDLESTGVSGVTCEKWVTCKDGFFGNIRCSGTRYCEVWRPRRLQFEEEAPEAAEKTEQSADTTVDEPSAVDLESTGVSGVTCEKWVTCKDGFFGNIRCSGTRYCEVWRPRRLQFEEEAPEAAEKTEQSADSTVDEPSAVDFESTGVSGVTCEKWVTCKDGFFGNIRCSGTRYCEVWRPRRLQFEEEAPEAAEKTEQSADSTVDEPSAVDLESTGVSGATCEKWVTCKDGFFGDIRCSGTRYCEVWGPTWQSAVKEPSAVDFESTGVSGATCEKWVTCKDGFFGNIRCSGTRYCEVWGPAQVPHSATCKKWVTCKDGFFGNIRCSGTRYCEAWR